MSAIVCARPFHGARISGVGSPSSFTAARACSGWPTTTVLLLATANANLTAQDSRARRTCEPVRPPLFADMVCSSISHTGQSDPNAFSVRAVHGQRPDQILSTGQSAGTFTFEHERLPRAEGNAWAAEIFACLHRTRCWRPAGISGVSSQLRFR